MTVENLESVVNSYLSEFNLGCAVDNCDEIHISEEEEEEFDFEGLA